MRVSSLAVLQLAVAAELTAAFSSVQALTTQSRQASAPTKNFSGLRASVVPDQEQVETDASEDGDDGWRRADLFGTTLIDQTLEELETDEEYQETSKRIEQIGLEGVSREERTQRRRALTNLGIPSFSKFLVDQQKEVDAKADADAASTEAPEGSSNASRRKIYPLERKPTTILQLNIGLYCNMACSHCHVESSPLRKAEMMTAETAARCIQLLKSTPSVTTLDITGGAPELNSNFRYLVQTARAVRPDIDIIDRCNLTVLQEPGQEDLIDFLKDNNVHIVASLPCYSEDNVDKQRGRGVFDRSIAALLALNDAGYGKQNENTKLDLVYNPGGAFLPPEQAGLEVAYKKELKANFDITFDSLFTITNMPIKRFADYLHRNGELTQYMDLLVQNFNLETVDSLMCLDTVSVGWDGKIFDCDFNQQLGYGVGVDSIHRGGMTVYDVESLDELLAKRIRTDNHCFGCTAGMGSS